MQIGSELIYFCVGV